MLGFSANYASGAVESAYRFYWNVGGLPSNYSTRDYSWIERNSVELFTTYFGEYPLIRNSPTNASQEQWCNGGLPQLANLEGHAAAVIRDVRARINDSSYDGFAVVDYESWAQFNASSLTYQVRSVALELQANPALTPAAAYAAAEESFNSAAIKFMLATTAATRQVIPSAKVGFYGHPTRCYWSCDWESIRAVDL